MRYKTIDNDILFDDIFRLERLQQMGDPLERLNDIIDWEIFRPTLELIYEKDRKSNAGASSYCPILMFKILILQRYYNLSDFQTEYQILDRHSFSRFLGLVRSSAVPDEKTIWRFRDNITKLGLERDLFELFNEKLNNEGLLVSEGKIVDASFVEVPRQRNSEEENKHIKENDCIPESWESNVHKIRQKDIDARWAKKGSETFYGYKNHIKIDAKSKLIDEYTSSSAELHDSKVIELLIGDKSDENCDFYADSAYTGERCEEIIKKSDMNNKVNEKGTRGNPLTDQQKKRNKEKSKTRSRVEHVFGFMEYSMNKLYVRSIGFKRASTIIGLINLTYNLFRYEQIRRLQLM
ncbi:IS5 family transposase [Halosquirtibacter laminarini]|uniref:IS5 family transposase n=3 Tax=Halosquirtibacter laminarini TaxID=3374600 RepID=A0AC61NH29_9BACT|nr:IS5 family transposase [Prolixibacteraceae bacterium]QZE14315.1 IS5 family transposase [Prolixibacteraceae bacterium]QZE14969.1 IS5 family transposase [Prolixibacteraceae bacterium]